MAKVKDLTTGSPIKLMLLYALPVLAGNICQQIYNFADTIIVGQKLGENALAAVGTTGSMFFLVNGFVIGITSVLQFTYHSVLEQRIMTVCVIQFSMLLFCGD